jgi:ceramide glucosyltransferase
MEIVSSVTFLTVIDCFLFILCLSAIFFYSYAIYAGFIFAHNQPIEQKFQPPISILKPVCGLDPDAYTNLSSFCKQDYPQYQIIFAVLESNDPAIDIIKKIIYYFSDVDIQLIIGDLDSSSLLTTGANRKVSNLVNAISNAKYDFLLIADSDIRVTEDYLQRVIQPLENAKTGVVTCLYRSLAQGWVTVLEAIGTATEFHAGVLVSKQLEGIKFALGSTIVIRKTVLEAIGGFTAISDYLADDFQLGYLPAQAGYQVVVSDYIVEHVLATTTLTDSLQRQIRWARGTRVSRPWGYLGLIFTYGTATSLLFLIITTGSTLSWVILSATWLIRLIMAWFIGVNILKDPQAKRYIWLVPIRDLISFVIWIYSFVGNTIEWRGRRLKLTKGGKLVQIS